VRPYPLGRVSWRYLHLEAIDFNAPSVLVSNLAAISSTASYPADTPYACHVLSNRPRRNNAPTLVWITSMMEYVTPPARRRLAAVSVVLYGHRQVVTREGLERPAKYRSMPVRWSTRHFTPVVSVPMRCSSRPDRPRSPCLSG